MKLVSYVWYVSGDPDGALFAERHERSLFPAEGPAQTSRVDYREVWSYAGSAYKVQS